MTANTLYFGALTGSKNSGWPSNNDFSNHCVRMFLGDRNPKERPAHYSIWKKSEDDTAAPALPDQNELVQIDFSALAPWKGVERMIDEWGALSMDWDADDGIPPRRAALGSLRKFIERAIQARVPAPRGYIASDGEIGLKWDSGERIATISFLHDGRFLAFTPRPGGEPIRISGDYSASVNVADFLQAIRQLT